MDTWAPKQLKMMQVLSAPASLRLSFLPCAPSPNAWWWLGLLCAVVQLGGNGNFKRYMEEHGVPANVSLVDKYNSEVCRVYKDKINRLAEVPCATTTARGALMFVRPRRAQQAATVTALTRNFCCFQGKPWQSPKQKPTFRSSQGGLGSLGSSGNSSQNSGSGSGSGSRGKKVPNLQHPHAGFHRATA